MDIYFILRFLSKKVVYIFNKFYSYLIHSNINQCFVVTILYLTKHSSFYNTYCIIEGYTRQALLCESEILR